ncbi:carboxypeptidase-like regulatory domain-containing protein [Micromonospora sp. NBC_01638]|uniref:carboxypeptidase-like regulatory domain-containing protein n=1 Tax=Micromonospora sp. NBC_01638 TaxID=2975982 RepID=UPI003864791D|nr:carboxypeptidase-like regulatory domain-containing protein [Micromonospora sp. NBC_01638]
MRRPEPGSTIVLGTSGARIRRDVRLSLNERTVSGVIRDSLGQPVRGAEVWLAHRKLPTVRMTTAADGVYRFTKVPESDVATYVYANVTGCQRDGRLYLPTIIGGDAVNDITVVAPMGVVDGATVGIEDADSSHAGRDMPLTPTG